MVQRAPHVQQCPLKGDLQQKVARNYIFPLINQSELVYTLKTFIYPHLSSLGTEWADMVLFILLPNKMFQDKNYFCSFFSIVPFQTLGFETLELSLAQTCKRYPSFSVNRYVENLPIFNKFNRNLAKVLSNFGEFLCYLAILNSSKRQF